jgi:hypothetical protein
LTLVNVADWVEQWGRHSSGRLRFFADLNPTRFFELVAKPLLSIKTTGSNSIERVAKPLKRRVATKERNRLSNDKATMLLRAEMNLRLKKESFDSTKRTLGQANLDNQLVYE